MALASAGTMLGLGLTLGAVPALAAPSPAAVPRSVAAGEKTATGNSLTGAESRVNIAELIQDGSRAEPATTPAPDAERNGSAQAAAATANGAYAGLAAVNDSSTWVMTSNGSSALNPPALWSSSAFYGSLATLSGDLTGNGDSDLVAVNSNSVWVMLSSGTTFAAPVEWSSVPFYGTRAILLADLTGNGMDDLVAVNNNSVWVMLSTGSGFGPPVEWSSTTFYGSVTTVAADVTGGADADLVAVNAGSTWVMTSTGSAFGSPTEWSSNPFYGSIMTLAADVTGGADADLVAVNADSTWVMTSNGSSFGTPTEWSSSAFYGSHVTLVGDVNGDGDDDLIAVNGTSTWVMLSNGSSAFGAPTEWSSSAFYGSQATLVDLGPKSLTPVAITTTSLPTGTVGTHFSATLDAQGGIPPYSWTVASGSLPDGLTLSASGVISGTPSAASTFNFAVGVADSTTPIAESASEGLSVIVYLAAPTEQGSPNWSGYVIGNGPYTHVSGTFNVPELYASATATYATEWAGIDGGTIVDDTDLIQAGVQEVYEPDTNLVYLLPWWEILPSDPTEVEISGMSVLPGDSMTVTIGQISGTDWAIELTNNTTGVTFTTDQTYTGPGSCVEWIMEAPEVDGTISTLGEYTPDVAFTNLSLTGAQNVLYEDFMIQSDVLVATPSVFTSSGFTVAYGDVTPSPP